MACPLPCLPSALSPPPLPCSSLRRTPQVAKEYCEQLGVDNCVKLFEQFKSYEGLFFFLGSYLSTRCEHGCVWRLVGSKQQADIGLTCCLPGDGVNCSSGA